MEEGYEDEIGRQMRSFAEGFGSAMHSKIMNFFQPQELMEMVVGNENYDWNLFRKVRLFSFLIENFIERLRVVMISSPYL